MPHEPVWATWMLREPMRTILESITAMATTIREHTGDRGLLRVTLRQDLAVRMGIAPGTAVKVNTAAGEVEVYCEPDAAPVGSLRLHRSGPLCFMLNDVPFGGHRTIECASVAGTPPGTVTLTGPPLTEIAPGLYRLHWKAGGSSLAAVGLLDDGSRWYALPGHAPFLDRLDEVAGVDWSIVAGAERIEAGPLRSDP